MSYNNPDIPLIEKPIGIDAVIQSIQMQLSKKLPWLEKSFGRAWEFSDDDGTRIPKAYLGNGEYMNVLPNDNLKSQSFIMCKGPEYPDGIGKERTLSIIFWFNLKEIYPSKEHIYTEELKHEVEKVLLSGRFIKEIAGYYDERAEDVFDGYVSSRGRDYLKDSRFLMHPYSGFRFDILVGYPSENVPCFNWENI